MLVATMIGGNGKSRSGTDFIKYLQQNEGVDYYADKNATQLQMSCYHGGGAEALGLQGKVTNDVLNNLARGFSPDGKPMCQNAGDPSRRFGYDLTFSAPKSLSVLFAMSDEETRAKILKAQQAAVATAFSFIEKQAFTRRGKTGSNDAKEVSCKLIGLEINHLENRNLDAQLHSHLFVPNLAVDENGHWATFDNKVMMELQCSGGAIYRAELAKNMQASGFKITKDVRLDKKNQEEGIYFNISGVTDESVDAFSSRRKEILKYMEKHGVSDDQAWARTRKAKQEDLSYGDLSEVWKKTLATLTNLPTISELQEQESKTVEISDEDLLSKLHRTESIFTRTALIERVALEYVGIMDLEAIENKVDALLKSENVVELMDDVKGRKQYTSKAMLQMEQSIIDGAAKRQHDKSVILTQEQVDTAIRSFEEKKKVSLSPEQRMAVEFVCMKSGGTACLSGLAGTGKTFSSLAYIHAYELQGYKAIGVAIANKAAKKLHQDTGIVTYNAMKLENMLDNGKVKIDSKTIIILDEAGMAGAKTISRLQKRCDAVGAKLVLMGDALQLQPVEASGAFSLAIQTIGDVKLSGIQRQSYTEDRVTASMFYGLSEDVIRDFWHKTHELNSLKVMLKLEPAFTQEQFVDKAAEMKIRVSLAEFRDHGKYEVSGNPSLFTSTQDASRVAELEDEIDALDNRRIKESMTDLGAQGATIFERMQQRGQAAQFEDDPAAVKQLLTDYFASSESVDEKLVIAGTQFQVHSLNTTIHNKLKEQGALTDKGCVLSIVQNDMSTIPVEFCAGDRIKFTEKDKYDPITKKHSLNVTNGDEGVIKNIEADDKGHFNMTVLLTNEDKSYERTITFNTAHYKDLALNYAMTVHASQGQGKNAVFSLCSSRMANRHLSLVAFTRMKKSFKLYGTEEDFEQMGDKLQKTQLKTNAVALARKEELHRIVSENKLLSIYEFKQSIIANSRSAMDYVKSGFTDFMRGKPKVLPVVQIIKPKIQSVMPEYDINLMLARAVDEKDATKRYHMAQMYIEKYKANVNAQSKNGETILFMAVKNNDAKMVEFLLKNGANPNHPNEDGSTITDLFNIRKENVGVLQNHGHIKTGDGKLRFFAEVKYDDGKVVRFTGSRIGIEFNNLKAEIGELFTIKKFASLSLGHGGYNYTVTRAENIQTEIQLQIEKALVNSPAIMPVKKEHRLKFPKATRQVAATIQPVQISPAIDKPVGRSFSRS